MAATQTLATPANWQDNWPQWRGPLARGVAPKATPPLEWSETKNVRWKIAVPGAGTSTPVIWGDQVFVLTALKKPKSPDAAAETAPAEPAAAPEGQRPRGRGRPEAQTDNYEFVVLCLDRKTGKTLWQKTACETVPHEGHHRDHGFASASPVTDGEHVLAYFGSRGLYCYDMQGDLKWSKDFGDMRTRNSFGEGASPAIHGDVVIVNWDHEGEDDFIVALDKATGKELWRKSRSEATNWSTPLVVEHDGKTQVVVNATGKVRSYDLKTGEEIWNCGGQTANVIPSPVTDKGMLIAMSGFRGAAIRAIKLGATGELDGTDAVIWSHNKSTPYVPSPLLVDDLLYFVSGNNGMLSCFDATAGKQHYEAERLDGVFGIYASPVAAAGHVYVLGRDGTCLVLKQGPNLEIVSRNKLDDKTDASIALVGKDLFIRGHENLYCIATD
jgi:outer membrane protein assembly factor BamB